MQVLVTGANGFVGRALCGEAVARGLSVRGASRLKCELPKDVNNVVIGDVDADTAWQTALLGCEAVVHLAARVHVMREATADPLAAFRQVNVDATLNLARQAAVAGVRRFIFISSIKVNGDITSPGEPFKADDPPAPTCPYGVSKQEAELALHQLAMQTEMELVIIRPPLVYGPGVKANFASMMRWLRCGVPLPLGAIHNLRSFIAIDNLVDLILLSLRHPAAAGQIFLASDGEDVSTTGLLNRMAKAMGFSAHLVPIPAKWLEWLASALGKRDVAQRLLCSLQVDIEKTKRLLEWQPLLTLDQGLRRVLAGRDDEKVV